MSPIYKYLLIASLIISSNSEIEYGTCTDDKIKIKLEDGTIKTFDCLKCDKGFYTQYEDDQLKCIKCPENSDNYGNDILIDIFTQKILSRYSFEFNTECDNEDKLLCPIWEKNIFSLKLKNIKDNINSKSLLRLNKYYVEDGEFIIKYINYNGDANRYLLIYINNILVYKDETRHSKEKTKQFKINKGNNIIEIYYIIDKNLSPKDKSDIESFLEIYEIKMTKAETSSLECQKYDKIEILKNTILDNCDYYVNKCTKDDICTNRFYYETSEGNDINKGTQIINYTKIEEGNCSELIPPADIEIEADQCSYGQLRNLKENDIYTCEHCPENTYNNILINDNYTCKNDCDIINKEYKKIFYINSFKDQSQFDYNISIIDSIGYIEINYEKYNLTEDTIIFVELDKNITNKTYKLINPNEIQDDSKFMFKIPISKGQYEFHIKGKNLKIKIIKIINNEEGGNYLCINKLNPKEEIICPSNEYFSPNINICRECPLFLSINDNLKCEFIEQIFNGNFVFDNALMLQSNLFLNDNIIDGKNNKKYHINLNPTFPLIYEYDSDSNFKIIGDELDMMKLVRGMNNRGIIFSYIHEDENQKYASHIYVKCNKTESNGTIELINQNELDFTIHYYFTVESNVTCPYCLDSEINDIKTDGICNANSTELFNVEIKVNSTCVIKPFEDAYSSLIMNDNALFILHYNSSSLEDQSLIINYNIKEHIPVTYEKEGDDIITGYQRYKKCKNETEPEENNNNESFPVLYIILIAVGSLIVIILIIFIIWKVHKSRKMDNFENEIEDLKDMKLKDNSQDN